MSENRFIVRVSLILFLCCMCAAGIGAQTASFSGDISFSVGGDTLTGKIHVTKSHYRLQMDQGYRTILVIVDRKAGLTRMLIPDIKQYIEMKSDDPMGLMFNPLHGIFYTESYADKKHLGTELIGDHKCDKYMLSRNGKDLMTYWASQKLDFPIKGIDHISQDASLSLDNITIHPVDDTLFDTPEGYTEMYSPDKEPDKVTDWAADIPSAPSLTPPFDLEMSEGEIARVKTEPGKSIWIRAIDQKEIENDARAIPFKDSKPLQNPVGYENFAQSGVICKQINELVSEADEVVIRVFNGDMAVQVKYFPMRETLISSGENFAYEIQSQKNIHLRSVNIASVESEFVISYSIGGKELDGEIIGPESFRTFSIGVGKASSRTMNPHGDTMIIRLKKGSVAIKVGQYDSSEW